MIYQVPNMSWNPTPLQQKKETLSGPSRGWKPITQQQKKLPSLQRPDIHKHTLKSHLLLINFILFQIKRTRFSLVFPTYVQFGTQIVVIVFSLLSRQMF